MGPLPKCCSHACAWLSENQAAPWHRLPVGVLKEDDVGSKLWDATLVVFHSNGDSGPSVTLLWHKPSIFLGTCGAG